MSETFSLKKGKREAGSMLVAVIPKRDRFTLEFDIICILHTTELTQTFGP